jgi:hypothetical protein
MKTTTSKIGLSLMILLAILYFLPNASNLKNTTSRMLAIFSIENRDNLRRGQESFDVTRCDSVSVASVSYSNGEHFRIKNLSLGTIWLKCVMANSTPSQTDTVRWPFLPGWNPEVVTVILHDANNTVTRIYIGR